MITINDPLLKLHENSSIPAPIMAYLSGIIKSMSEDVAVEDEDTPDGFFGGYINIVETVEDLKEIKLCLDNPDTGDYYSLYEMSGEVDAAVQLDGYVCIFTATNNSGGPQYFIPQSCVTAHVLRTLELTGGES